MNFLKSRLTALSFSAVMIFLPTQAFAQTDFTSQFNEIIETADYETGIASFVSNTKQNPGKQSGKARIGRPAVSQCPPRHSTRPIQIWRRKHISKQKPEVDPPRLQNPGCPKPNARTRYLQQDKGNAGELRVSAGTSK